MSLNPKFVGGKHVDSVLYDISSPAIDIYVNNFYSSKRSPHFERNLKDPEGGSAPTATKYGRVKKIESLAM
ncbi:unnamed protein product [Brassica oleracea var. botrytis]